MAKDLWGSELVEGDEVAYNPPRYKGLMRGKIIKITAQKVQVAPLKPVHWCTDPSYVFHSEVSKKIQ